MGWISKVARASKTAVKSAYKATVNLTTNRKHHTCP